MFDGIVVATINIIVCNVCNILFVNQCIFRLKEKYYVRVGFFKEKH
ncbi:MAG: hypothetical protein BWX92_03752 [Deltaproteobacteria bacterium ADurb.Bin135]|nr:MAG: hypothetical protein BWX92_03752 [Deltaproteobacteria bacterium ADurb.Bin135]